MIQFRLGWSVFGAGALLLLILCLLAPGTALAGGVVGTGSAGSCTEPALDAALAGGGAITFSCGTAPFTITLTSTKLIAADTGIDGGSLITLQGGAISVTAASKLSLANLTISGASSAGDGGAVHNAGELDVSHVVFVADTATGLLMSRGGAIYNQGLLRVADSRFTANGDLSSRRLDGGAIYSSGTATVTNTSFDLNRASNFSAGGGGAIYNAGTLAVSGGSFSGNETAGGFGAGPECGGGAIYNLGTLTVTGTSFADNSTTVRGDSSDICQGGAIYTNGQLSLSHSLFQSNGSGRDGGTVFVGPLGRASMDSAQVVSSTAREWGGNIYSSGSLTVTNSILTQGVAADGAGIYNAAGAHLRAISVTVSSNTSSHYEGGGLANFGAADIVSATITANAAPTWGSGIYNYGTLALAGSRVFANLGMGLYNGMGSQAAITATAIFSQTLTQANTDGAGIFNDGVMSLVDSSVTGNSVALDGGGIVLYMPNSRLTVVNSTIAHNSAGQFGGGIFSNGAQVDIYGSRVYGNNAARGGGIYFATGTNTISNTAVYSNSLDGIAMFSGSVVNSTISGNTGAGVYGSTSLSFDTITHNTYGLIGSGYLANSVLAQNTQNCLTPYSAPFISYGYNVLGPIPPLGCQFFTMADKTDIADPLLGPLGDNGGRTWTQALLAGSPAIDAADPASLLGYDQIGTPRPQPAGGQSDAGAYERSERAFHFSAAAYAAREDAGTAVITVTVGSAPLPRPASVAIRSSDGSAAAGVDYEAISRTLTFPAGSTYVTTTVPVLNDGALGPDKSLTLALSRPAGIAMGIPNTATLTVLDIGPRLQLAAAGYSAAENHGPAVITVTLSPVSAAPVTVEFHTADGSASGASDYAAVNRTVSIPPGAGLVTVTVPITDDLLSEANETVNLSLSVPANATLGRAAALLTIQDNEPLALVVNDLGDLPDAVPGDGICDRAPSTPGRQCTLRAAIEESNGRQAANLITFSVTGSIVLTGTLPAITQGVDIQGPGADTLSVDAGVWRAFGFSAGAAQTSRLSGLGVLRGQAPYGGSYPGGGALYVGAGQTVMASGLTISGSLGYGGFGGAVLVEGGALHLSGSVIRDSVGSQGGALAMVSGSAYLTNTALYGNSASMTGGAIFTLAGALSCDHCTMHDNRTLEGGYYGGAVFTGGSAAIANSTFYSNTAYGAGGALTNSGTLTVTDSQFIGNRSTNGHGGAIANWARLTLSGGTLVDNAGGSGGGLANTDNGEATISASLVYSNSAILQGGGLFNSAALTITNSTIGHNRAFLAGNGIGGGFYNLGTAELYNVSVAGNSAATSAGGLWSGASPLALHGTLVADNVAPGSGRDISGTVSSLGYNLVGVGDGAGGLVSSDLKGTGALPLDAHLAAFDGQVYRLLEGSPAIDAAGNAGCPATDQLGAPRPYDGDHDGNAVCDIGAVEWALAVGDYRLYLPALRR